jgi:hypothetical protein
MIKQLALVLVLIAGVGTSVIVLQKATQLNSDAFSILDFVSSFHSSAGDPSYNTELDINRDGKINTLDILRDRYSQEATRSSTTGDPALENILEELNEVEDSSGTADEI